MKPNIIKHIAEDIVFQNYDKGTPIQDVFVHCLSKHMALEGWFMELFRMDENILDIPIQFRPKQISLSCATPNRINAFHIHPKEIQDELWCVIQGSMKVWLIDTREGSSTRDGKECFILHGGSPSLLFIPSGVAHGYIAGHDGALLLYAVNNQFNSKDPNEGRLPWDYFGEELWSENRG